MIYLLAVDLLKPGSIMKPGLPLKLVTFGAPRVGDESWSTLYNQLLDDYRSEHGAESVHEYCIKGFNDGTNSPFTLTPNSQLHGNSPRSPPFATLGIRVSPLYQKTNLFLQRQAIPRPRK